MSDNKAATTPSREKRDPGFAQIRRGLKEHLHRSKMSSNGVKLYLWCQLSADWSGATRGCVQTDYHSIARALGWGTRMVQRTVSELNGRYIEVTLAANQYELTTIKILKFDTNRSRSAVDEGDHSKQSAVDSAADRALDKNVHNTVHSNCLNAQSQQDLRPAKKSIEVKERIEGKKDAVRRRGDAELRVPKRALSLSEKNQKLQGRLAAKIEERDDSFARHIDYCKNKGLEHPWGRPEREAFGAVQYQPDLLSPMLTWDFVDAVLEVFDQNRGKDVSPGNLCSKVIDLCERQRKSGGGY